MPFVQPDYHAPGWCPGGHLQTVIPARLLPRPSVEFRRERVELPDGDFMLWDWALPEPSDPKAPVVVLFHGLEGDSSSHYVKALMDAVVHRGWRGVVAMFRSCGGELNRLPRAYHAGDTADNSFVLRSVHARFPEAKLYAVGVSLGGNQLVRHLGELGEDASYIEAAVSVGAPLDLVVGSERMSKGVNVFYENMFLKTLLKKLEEKARRFPDVIDMEKVRACRSMYDFDDIYTSRIHGFRSAMDYWTRCSGKPVLPGVRVPLLLLNAKNDPFFAAWALPAEKDVSGFVTMDYPDEGGHIGFPAGARPGNILYLPRRIMRWFDTGA